MVVLCLVIISISMNVAVCGVISVVVMTFDYYLNILVNVITLFSSLYFIGRVKQAFHHWSASGMH